VRLRSKIIFKIREVTIDEYDNEDDGFNIRLDNKPIVRESGTIISSSTKGNNLIDDLTSIFAGVSTIPSNPVPVTNNINDIFGLGQFTMTETKQSENKNDIFMNFENVILLNTRLYQ
jgi:hypothetical protein